MPHRHHHHHHSHHHHHLGHLSDRLSGQQQHLTSLLGKAVTSSSGGGGGTAQVPAAPAASLVIQLPTTSATTTTAPPSAPESATQSATTRRQVTTTSGEQSVPTPQRAAAATAAANTNYDCHHQAATRDLMLSHKQSRSRHQRSYRHKYLNAHLAATTGLAGPSFSRVAAAGREADLEREQQQQQQLAVDVSSATATTSDNNSEESSSTSSSSSSSVTPPPNYHEIPGIVPSYHGRTSGPPPAYDDVVNPHAPPPSYQSLFGQVREARKSSNGLVDLLRQLFLVLIGTIGCTMIIGFLLLIPITMILVGFFYINECRAENIPSFLVVGGFVWIVKNMLNCYNQFKKDSQTINRPPPPPAGRRPAAAAATAAVASSSTSGAARVTPASVSGNSSSSAQSSNQLREVVATSGTSTSTTVTATTTTTTTNSDQQQRAGNATQRAATTTTTTMSATSQRQQQQQLRHPQMIGLTSYKCESFLNYFLVVWFLAGCIVVYRIYEPDYDNPLSLSYCNRTVYLYAFWLLTSAFIMMALVLSCLCCLMASSLMSCSHGR